MAEVPRLPSRSGGRLEFLALAALAIGVPSPAVAEQWIPAGNTRLRHDLQVLSDAGLLTGPSLSWPIARPQLAGELGRVDSGVLRSDQRAALQRIRAEIGLDQPPGETRVSALLAGAANPDQLRTFEDTPRESGEATIAMERLGSRFAWNLEATVVTNPDDGQTLRPDGSYVAAILGNWALSAGYVDRWWGPGWEGSLILSTNARPVPSIGLDRSEPRPFDLPVLRWLGPWRLSTFMGRLEQDRDYAHALLFGLRVEVRPHSTLQIAASRTAQWCGDGRPCSLDTFWDLLVGNDNTVAGSPQDDEPGNQLAGFDIRWSWPGGRVPLALYAQGIGEDEAGLLPSRYLGLFGAEAWGEAGNGSWRVHAEYADTTCDFVSSEPAFGCAYTHSIYATGYRYRGRAIGHAMDADGESIGVGGMFVDPAGHLWQFLARDLKLNREGAAPGHSLAHAPAHVRDVSVAHERAFAWGNISVSLGYTDVETTASTVVHDGVRGFLTWSHGFD